MKESKRERVCVWERERKGAEEWQRDEKTI